MKVERRGLLSTIWITSVVLLLAPLWYALMATHRAPLDYDRLDDLDRNINELLAVRIPIHIQASEQHLTDIVEASQLLVDRRLAAENITNWRPDLSASEDEATVVVELKEGETYHYFLPESGKRVGVSYDQDLLLQGRLPEAVADLLLGQVFADELRYFSKGDSALSDVVARYAAQYHLTFSLLVEDGAQHTWEIASALSGLDGLRGALAECAVNTTVDSQIQYYARMGCEIQPQSSGGWVLGEYELPTFINFAEWSLASSHAYPTLHFVLYVPSIEHTPLTVQNSETNSFMVAQWGGLAVLNRPHGEYSKHLSAQDLMPVINVFANQLLSLLGAPATPKSPQLRVGSLARITAARSVKAAAAALGSLRRLALHMPNIAIPDRVAPASQAAVAALDSALRALRDGLACAASSAGSLAFNSAERAFFDHQMVTQMFFPDEHKLAVYMPLLGPLGVVLASGWYRMHRRTQFDPEFESEIQAAYVAAQRLAKEHE